MTPLAPHLFTRRPLHPLPPILVLLYVLSPTPAPASLPCLQLANKVDVIFALAQAWCMSESDADFEMLEKRLEALTPDESILVREDGVALFPKSSAGCLGTGTPTGAADAAGVWG